jgi:transcription-repair coupling factor (superfamily II helicase)
MASGQKSKMSIDALDSLCVSNKYIEKYIKLKEKSGSGISAKAKELSKEALILQPKIEKIIMKNGKLIGYFVADQQSAYYNSKQFRQMLQFVQQNGNICKMKEKETKNGLRLLLTFENVKSIGKALDMMELMEK